VTSSPTWTTEPGWSTCFQLAPRRAPGRPCREVDEGAEVTTVLTTPCGSRRLELGEKRSRWSRWVSPGRPPREDHVVAVLVELDDLRLGASGPRRAGGRDTAQVDERRRQEAAQADVEDQAALDDLDDGPRDHALLFLELLDPAPGPLVLGPLLRQDEAAVLVLFLEDERFDLVAQRHDLVGVDVVADRELARRDDPLGLEPMSRSTSSASILTTCPATRPPSSNSTMVASMASESDWSPRSSRTTSVMRSSVTPSSPAPSPVPGSADGLMAGSSWPGPSCACWFEPGAGASGRVPAAGASATGVVASPCT